MVNNSIFTPFKKHINCESKHFVEKIGHIFLKETIVKKISRIQKITKNKIKIKIKIMIWDEIKQIKKF
jgi:hypothetical protein